MSQRTSWLSTAVSICGNAADVYHTVRASNMSKCQLESLRSWDRGYERPRGRALGISAGLFATTGRGCVFTGRLVRRSWQTSGSDGKETGSLSEGDKETQHSIRSAAAPSHRLPPGGHPRAGRRGPQRRTPRPRGDQVFCSAGRALAEVRGSNASRLSPPSTPSFLTIGSFIMVQGQTKGLSKQKAGSGARHAQKAAAAPKKGKRYVAPKKAAAVKQAAMHKVCPPSCNLPRPLHTPSIAHVRIHRRRRSDRDPATRR